MTPVAADVKGTTKEGKSPVPSRVRRPIAGVVLLGGSVRASEFHGALGRSPLDLPCRAGQTLLNAWCDGVAALGEAWGQEIPLRLLADQSSLSPTLVAHKVKLSMDKDPIEWRGTGGVLRDISGTYGEDDLILVANATQVLMRPLPELTKPLEELGADVAVLAHGDGTPSTLMLVRCGVLAALPAVGFVDMKEQAIPLLAAQHLVKVVSVPRAVTMGVRTAAGYLLALRAYHELLAGGEAREMWRSVFSIVEEGATVEEGVRMHDSVVLAGAKVERGAVLVRTVVCGGARVGRQERVVDQVVLPGGRRVATEESA